MTDGELTAAIRDAHSLGLPVNVTANDYSYPGWLMFAGLKRSRALRCVVEDEHGRLFIHNASQLSLR